MKTSVVKFTILYSFMLLSSFACEENEQVSINDCVEVKKIESICGETVLQIVDPAFYYLGETWSNHSNVFYTDLNCKEFDLPEDGNTFLVRISSWPDSTIYNPACIRCLATVGYTGEKKYVVEKVTACFSE